MSGDYGSPEALREKLRIGFDEFDIDKSGRISLDELQCALESSGLKPSPQEVQMLLDALDENRDGTLDFDEFAKGVVDLGLKVRVIMEIRKTFNDIDVDKNGFIDKNDVHKLMEQTAYKDHLTEKEIDDFIASADVSGDGQISFEEFADSCAGKLTVSVS